MADIIPEIGPQVLEACTANAEELAGAIGRAFDGEFVVKPGETAPLELEAKQGELTGSGMVFSFKFGEVGIAAFVTSESGVLPDWCSDPDPTGESKLSTLGQELSMLLVPDDLMADSFEAVWQEELPTVFSAAEPSDGAICLPLELAMGEKLATMHMVWPLAKPDELLAKKEEPSKEAETLESSAEEKDTDAEDQESSNAGSSIFSRIPSDYSELPPNTLSLLKVLVPISVNLASKKQRLDEVVEFGPGSIITFDKLCNDPLEITVGERPIAEGDAVKVGEKFGVRIRKMKLPDECFKTIFPPKVG